MTEVCGAAAPKRPLDQRTCGDDIGFIAEYRYGVNANIWGGAIFILDMRTMYGKHFKLLENIAVYHSLGERG